MSMTTARQKVLAHLYKTGSASVREITRTLKMSAANVRHHLRVLVSDGRLEMLSVRERDGRGRPEKVYSLPRAALALAFCGQTDQAKPLVDELTKRYPEDTIINAIWLPVIRAAIELQRGNAAATIEQLQTTVRYEAAGEFWPQYLRGQAYLNLKQGIEAATEFQKILDHRGQAPLSPLYPLAHLGLACSAALSGDLAKSRAAYEDFFKVWKSADADLPILIGANKEYQRSEQALTEPIR